MASDYTAYQNYYDYMSSLISQIQAVSDTGRQSGRIYNKKNSTEQSFSELYQTASQKMNVPESMDDIFREAAETYQVPVNLLMAVGKAESGFNPDAVSPAGAQGVMQLMPATAASLGVTDPFDARSNIMGGAKYLGQMLSQYNGNIELALAAYNAGSGNVAKYGGVPPFTETRNYIQRIKEYMGTDLTTGKTVTSQKDVGSRDEEESTVWGTLQSLQALQEISALQGIQNLSLLRQLQILSASQGSTYFGSSLYGQSTGSLGDLSSSQSLLNIGLMQSLQRTNLLRKINGEDTASSAETAQTYVELLKQQMQSSFSMLDLDSV